MVPPPRARYGIDRPMAELTSGPILKMKTELKEPVEYTLPIGDEFLVLNEFVGKRLSVSAH